MSPASFHVLVFSLIFFWYWVGNLAANPDKRAKTDEINLPLWARCILFLGHPNPFRLRSIIYKVLLLVTSIIMIALLFSAPDSRATAIVLILWMFGTPALALVLFGRTLFPNARWWW